MLRNFKLISLATLFVAIAGCEPAAERPDQPPALKTPAIDVLAIDELPGIGLDTTGLAFWAHPNVAFNALLIVASADGLISYHMEDGSEFARIDDITAQGVGVSYFGRGTDARGVVAAYDTNAQAFRMFEIDNLTRQFEAIPGDLAVRGDVRGFCFGRAIDAQTPELFIIQSNKISTYGFSVEDGHVRATPRAARTCPSVSYTHLTLPTIYSV